MKNRTLPPLKLEHSPLIFVLAQVRFSAVLQVERFVPEIQERLRHKGFPLFAQLQSRGIRFGGQTAELISSTRFAFMKKDQSAAVILAPDLVVLETTQYDVFERFVEELDVAIRVVTEVAKPAVAQRLGLRYVDLIHGDYTPLVAPGLRGLPAEALGPTNPNVRVEFAGAAPHGNYIIRLQSADGALLPPDLDPIPLRFSAEVAPNERATLLDLDAFSTEQRDFDPAALMMKMWDLHEFTDRAFRACVTPEAMQAWGARKA